MPAICRTPRSRSIRSVPAWRKSSKRWHGQGTVNTFAALPNPHGGITLEGTFSAEFRNAPALALLVRMAAALAPAQDQRVRDEQRRLMSEFFAALDSDYRRARPALLSGGASFPKSQF
jgi:hypothetical protein